MKLKIYLPLATLAFATAVPAPFSVSVSINEGSLSNSIENAVDACTLICAPRKINCPEGQYAWQRGKCWFCCICSSAHPHPKEDAESFATSLVAQGITEIGQYHPENMPLIHKDAENICWEICGKFPLECRKGWYSQKAGDCWTCCSCSSAPSISITETGNGLPAEANAKIKLSAVGL